MMPTTTADILPAFTCPLSVISMPRNPVIRSWATAPEAATMSPLTVPRTVAKAMAQMQEKIVTPKYFASSGADMLLLSMSRTPRHHGAKAHEQGQNVEKADGADGHDG